MANFRVDQDPASWRGIDTISFFTLVKLQGKKRRDEGKTLA
jgi:hypothetical protein